jgi:hypothetical protein
MKLTHYIIIATVSIGCGAKSAKPSNCTNKYLDILTNVEPKVFLLGQNDTIIQLQDVRNDTTGSYSLYTFDPSYRIMNYTFVNGNGYQFSLTYDENGRVIKQAGSPVVQYFYKKKSQALVEFTVFIFSLDIKYDEIHVTSNLGQEFEVDKLYKSRLYSNVKCFSFQLPVAKNFNQLELYVVGNGTDSCAQAAKSFSDTMSFRNSTLD